jgi:short-subunit dehydrogenase
MNIIVTGASKGIGFDTVLEFSKNNENKIIALARDITKLTELQNLCFEQNKTKIHIVSCDITNIAQSTLQQTLESFDNIDILINNAGLLINKPFLDLEKSEWQSMFEVNIFGIVELIKLVFPKLKTSKNPHIVNIGSIGGLQNTKKFAGLSAYTSSKASLSNLTECIAEEFLEYQIICNCLCLGAVNTEMLKQAFPNYKAQINSNEIATYICDFALNANKFINGKSIPISISIP